MAQVPEIHLIGPEDENGERTMLAWPVMPQCPCCLGPIVRPPNRGQTMLKCENCGEVLLVRFGTRDTVDDAIRSAMKPEANDAEDVADEREGEVPGA